MKVSLCLGFFVGVLSVLFSAGEVLACDEGLTVKCEIAQLAKVYVDSNQIQILPEGIFVDVGEEMHQVTEVSRDEVGFYVPYAGFYWKCDVGHPNPPWALVCQVCNFGRF